ncbi:Putative intracellular protease/amidase [Methanolobus vulcani]|uniref:Intracellular protease/amidase n=1 Tax=Methanolobus vulcani TaxID=38026 RepID=A0A7Z7FCN9_9EURY|nr:type 1 glutamine amidotransferase family protein [Methanolobus vulcani]SDF85152.1 Putative intracellular protease/amidase [Methanolobus vulcani]
MTKIAYLYVLDTMTDWEPSFLITELNMGRFFRIDAEKYTVKTVGITKESIVTMGGMRIVPDLSIDELSTDNAGVLIIPGGDTWLQSIHDPFISKVRDFLDAGVLVAAICGATMGLAKAGLLDNRTHTSNDLGFLKSICPNYAGETLYCNEPVVIGDNVITASGVAPLEFAREVLRELDVFSAGTLEAWYNLYTTHEAQYFYALMESLEK